MAEKTGIVPFMELVERVVTTEPCASAAHVYFVVDNGSSHNGQRSIDQMTAAWPNAHLVHLLVHASSLNQIEIVFSIVQPKSSNRPTSPTSTSWRRVFVASRCATT